MSDPSLAFCEGETVLAVHGPLIYEAKVMKIQKLDYKKEYFIHYRGWNKKWDEWVGIERLLKFTEENKKLMEELKLAQEEMERNPKSECLSNMTPKSPTENKKLMEQLKLEQQDMEKNPRSECLSNMKPKSSTDTKMDLEYTRKHVGKGKKRTADFSIEKQTRYDAAYEKLKPLGFLNKKVIRTKIDSLLKAYGGVEGWAFIEEASYKLLIECLLEGQEQLQLKDKEEENQGILLLKEEAEEVQETDEQLLKENSRKKRRRLSSVAGTTVAVDMYEPTISEPRTREEYLLPTAQKERLQERLGDGKLVSAQEQKSQENLTGSVLGTSQRRRKRPSFGFIDSTDDCEEDYAFFDTKSLLL